MAGIAIGGFRRENRRAKATALGLLAAVALLSPALESAMTGRVEMLSTYGLAETAVSLVLLFWWYHLDKAEHAATYQASQDLVDRAHSRRTISLVLGVTGVALIGGGVFHYMRHGKAESARLTLVPAPDGAAVSLGGRF